MISTRYLKHNSDSSQQYCILYVKAAKSLDIKCSCHTKDNYMTEMLANVTVVVILQYINASNQLLHTSNSHNVLCQTNKKI